MKIILSPHGGSGNHGCEAIVRSTVKILKGIDFELFSSSPGEDTKYGLDECCKLSAMQKPINRFSVRYLLARLDNSVDKFEKLAFAPILKAAKKSDLMMSIGGDNYCYGINEHILLINRAVRELGKKTVLWGCSIERQAMDNESIFKDLAAFDLIIARESITYNSLIKKGLRNVSLFPDPAFLLTRTDLPLPGRFIEGNTVGINISPMIISHERNKDSTLNNYIKLMEYIITGSDMNIALIPHVVWTHNDDRKPLLRLYSRFIHTGRVTLIKDATAPELRGYIARCRFFIAARTHASIAAYSECVPALVVGYSVKAKGIARDIFGTEENHVIDVQSLRKDDCLVEAFKHMYEHEAAIRNHYALMMEEYKAKAADAGKEIMKI